MRAVSSGRTATKDLDTDHGRPYVAMAEKFVDGVDIVAPSVGCVADKWPLQVKTSRSTAESAETVPGARPDGVAEIPGVGGRKSGPGA